MDDADEREEAATVFEVALKCGILCEAGSKKDKIINVLYTEAIAKQSPYYDLLSKFFHAELLLDKDLKEFIEKLDDAYACKLLERARVDHNIKVLASIYMNITFEELGNFLGISKEKAEQTVATLTAKGSINAILD